MEGLGGALASIRFEATGRRFWRTAEFEFSLQSIHRIISTMTARKALSVLCAALLLSSAAIYSVLLSSTVKESEHVMRSLLVKTNTRTRNTDDASLMLWTPRRLQQMGATLARPFTNHNHWCTHDGYHENTNTSQHLFKSPTGLLYTKVPKSASSTTAAVIHRISRNHGDCDFQNQHIRGAGKYYGNRNRSKSFLLGSIRDPASRAISRIFFHFVSKQGKRASESNILRWLQSEHAQYGSVSSVYGGFQSRYMTLRESIPPWSAWSHDAPTEVNNTKQIHEHVQQIINDYDFMVVVERMDESLVTLSILLEVDIGDIVLLDSKAQGTYTYVDRHCFQAVKAKTTPLVKEYLSSDRWFAQNYGDYLLHAAANSSLDKTIDSLGRKRVEEAVSEYRRLKSIALERCASKAFFPCSPEGKRQLKLSRESCYVKDEGCGYQCINDVLKSRAKDGMTYKATA